MPRILVCTTIDDNSLSLLRQVGEVDERPSLTAAELPDLIRPYDGLLVDSDTPVDGRVMEEAYQLRVIGRIGSRLDNIDVSTARALGIELCYSPGGSAIAVAEQTFALMLELTTRHGSGSLAGKTLGLIGFGRIGRQVARRARAFDMRLLVNQPRLTPELALSVGAEVVDLDDLLRQADFVSLHVPFKAETAQMIGARELALMPAHAGLINTAHAGLVDESALLAALNDGHLIGAALAAIDDDVADPLCRHPRVICTAPPAAAHFDRDEAAASVARQMAELLRARRPSETLSLEVVPIEQVVPHEQIDDKRVARLMASLAADNRLVNPPLVTQWRGQYIVMDGATRVTALRRLGYPHIVVQIVEPESEGFALHTWYHAISDGRSLDELLAALDDIQGLHFEPLPADQIPNVFERRPNAICYFLGRDGQAVLAVAEPGADRLAIMNGLVAGYTAWGNVERTLLTDLGRLLGQFPGMTAVAIFPQFAPSTVFDVAARGELLPAGLTRFVIPGRILRLNADLARLRADEPLPAKRAWLNEFLADKLSRSRLRYYQEPVILLDD